MNFLPVLYHIARADFLERVRRPSFFIVLIISLYGGYFFAPDADAGYVTVAIGNYRGIYNSAWIGAVFSLMCSTFLSLIGFYLVKNSIARDRETNVAQLLASTRLTGFQYLVGKTLSNFAVLSAVVGALLVTAVVTQLIRAEDTSINLWQIAAPSLIMALPMLLVISAIAVFFEVTPLLRGALGNVAYFFLWNAILIISLVPTEGRGKLITGLNDLPGITRLFESMAKELEPTMGVLSENVSLGIQIVTDGATNATYVWSGMDWHPSLILERLVWIALAFGIVLIATPVFRRFESLSLSPRKAKKSALPASEVVVIEPLNTHARLTRLDVPPRMSFLPLLRTEIWLAMRGLNRWWYIGMAVLMLVTLVTPLTVARQYIFPLAWIWPIAIWSAMGTREPKHRVEQIIFSAPHSLRYQLPAMWGTGVIITAIAGAVMGARFLMAGEMNSLFAWSVGVLFIPTFALAAGVWTGRALLFEGVYVALWYIGPMNQVPFIDFMGATPEVTPAITISFAIATAALAVLAVAGRRRQMTI